MRAAVSQTPTDPDYSSSWSRDTRLARSWRALDSLRSLVPRLAAPVQLGKGRPEGHLDLDLDGSSTRQRGDADRGPTVPPGGAEHLRQQPTRAVDHRRLLLESLHTRDEAEHAEHAFDPIEVPELGAQHGQRVQRAPAGCLGALLDGEVEPERARVDQRAVVVAWQLT